MRYVNGAKTMYGSGGTRRVIVGEYLTISGRRKYCQTTLMVELGIELPISLIFKRRLGCTLGPMDMETWTCWVI